MGFFLIIFIWTVLWIGWNSLIISEIILDVFNGLKMAYPKPSAKRRRELRLIRKRLVN